MNRFLDLFTPSRKVNIVNLYSLVPDILAWRSTGKYAIDGNLPTAISFDSGFWNRVEEIHRFTLADGHERAVSLWWVDGDYVLTQNIRGSEANVNIPSQKMQVSYEPTGKNDKYIKRVVCNGKQYLRKTVSQSKIPQKGSVNISHLFNMHTHPANELGSYGWFSNVDIESFMNSQTAITGMISDVLWLLVKTKEYKYMDSLESLKSADKIFQPTPEIVRDELNIRIYKAEFGKSAVNYLD